MLAAARLRVMRRAMIGQSEPACSAHTDLSERLLETMPDAVVIAHLEGRIAPVDQLVDALSSDS